MFPKPSFLLEERTHTHTHRRPVHLLRLLFLSDLAPLKQTTTLMRVFAFDPSLTHAHTAKIREGETIEQTGLLCVTLSHTHFVKSPSSLLTAGTGVLLPTRSRVWTR